MQQFNSERSCFSKFLSATRVVCLSFLILFLSVQAGAQNFIVNNNGDTHATAPATSPLDGSGNITLRSAVEAATAQSGSHIITFAGGITTINLTLNQISVGSATSSNITITGPGMNVLTVNQTTAARIFSTTTQPNFNFTLQEMTLNYAGPTNIAGNLAGSFSGGGGALLAGGTGAVTTVTNCKITNWRNQSGNGGAVAVTFSTVSHNFTMSGCVFDNNMCGGGGGAVAYSGLGTVNISNCTFTGNSCGPVGLNIGGSGGALNLTGQAPGGTYSVTECTFVNNSCANATSPGGAVMNVNGQLALNYNRFIGNTAVAGGSAVYQSGGDAAYVINATNNWWGHNTAPTAAEVSNGPAPVTPPNVTKWLQLKLSASPATLCATTSPTSAVVTASFLSNSSNEAISASNLGAIIGLPISFSATLGTLSGAQTTIQASGTATVTFTSNGTAGSATVNGVVDNVPSNDPTARATITVNILPNISTQPTNQTTCAGSTTTFTVTAGGTPTPGYQWRKGTTNLANGATGNGSTISGATTNTLTINNTALADAAADYNVVVSNSCGTVISGNVSLTVKALPVVTAPTVTQPTCTTPTGTIVVNATGASGTIEYSINNGGSYQASNTFTGIAPSTNANVVVRYTASPNCPVAYASNPVVINAVPLPPTVNNPATTTGTVGVAFSQTFTTTGGLAPITFATTSTLPTGLTLSSAGVLSGTPTQPGTFPIVVKATDANGCVGTGSTYNLVISCQTITVTNPAVTTGTNGTAFSQTFTQTGGNGTTTFSTTSTLPTGLTLSSAGVLSGTPAQSGTFPIVVKATDANGCFGNGPTYNLVISCQTITVTNPVNATGQLNIPFSETFTQTGGIGATTFSTTSTLPTGLTLSSAGVLSGTPIQSGTFPIVVKATDANGCFANGPTYTLVINTCPTITVTNPVNASGTVGTAFSESFSAAGGLAPYTYSTLSTLPTGLTLSSAGVLSGTPMQSGTFPIVVKATDDNGCSGNGPTYTLVIGCPAVTVNSVGNQVVCNGGSTTAVTFSGSPAGTVFNWTNNAPSIGLAGSGSGDIASFTATNATNAPVVATITVTPTYGVNCNGTPTTFTITVNPTATVTAVANQTVCNNANTAAVTFSSPTTGGTIVYDWTNNTPSIGLAGSGSGNIASFTGTNITNAPVTATITVTPSYTNAGVTCEGTPTTFTITVNPTPTVNTVSNQAVCNGGPTTAVTFSGAVTGTVYNWTNNTPSIGLAGSGSGNIGSFTATNATNAPVTATITVTPSYTNNGTTCTGTPTTFTITVNPSNTVTQVAPQTVCNGASTTAITFSSSATGGTVVYNWTGTDGTIGLPTTGSGNIASFTATNTGTTVVSDTIKVTAAYTNGGTTCSSAIMLFIITVDPTATVNTVADQTVCNGASTTAVSFSGTVPGTVYQWTNNTTSIGLAASGTGNIASFTATNATAAPVTATVTVTPVFYNQTIMGSLAPGDLTMPSRLFRDGVASSCAAPKAFPGTSGGAHLYETYTFANTTGQSQCVAISYAAKSTGDVFVAAYNNSFNPAALSTNYLADGGLSSIGGSVTNFSVTVASGATLVLVALEANSAPCPSYALSVSGIGMSCSGTPKTFNITVNPTPTVNTVANQTVCNGAPTAAVTFSGAVTGTVYNWTNNTTSIGLAGSGTGNIASFNGVNAGTTPVTATITVTPSYTNNGTTCTGTPTTFTITVNPTPTVNSVSNQVVCNGAPTAAVTFSGAVTGTVYNWTNNTTSIGLAGSGTGNIASFNGVNATNAPVTATITVTPSYTNGGTTCTGTPTTFTITVNPTPTVNAVSNQELCNGATTTAVNFSGAVTGTVYNWTNNTTSIGLAGSGSGNIAPFTAVNLTNSPVIATITVTPSYTNAGTTCTGTPITFTITVDPKAHVNPVSNQVVCNGAPTAAVTFSGNTSNTVYNWTNNTPSIGLTGSGSGNIASFNAVNTTGAPVVATITVTPAFTGGSGSCPGDPITFTITVNPTPTVNTVTNQTVCNGAPTAAVTFSGNAAGTVYNWTNNTTSIGLAGSGSGNIASFNGVNAGTAPVTATITVTPSYTNAGTTCTGSPITFTITVNPTPTVNTVSNQVVCNNANTTAVTFSGAVTGTVYNWTNNTTSIGLAGSGSGNIASFVATNITNAAVVATITVTPSYTNNGTTCTGTPKTFTITVNPTPTVNSVTNQTVCNGAPTAAVTFSGFVPGTVYSWTNNTTSIGLAANGSGNIASFNGVNATNAPVTATITVTPSYTNAGTTCTGTPTTFTITVNPTPTVNAVANQVVCNNANTTAVTFSGATTGTVYNWTNNTTSIGLAGSGTGNIASFVATNSTNAPVVATITVTPSYTNNGTTCTGTPITFTITVNPTPTVNSVANQTVCNGAPTAAVNFSGFVPGTVYSWTNNTTSIGLAGSGTGNIASFNGVNPTNLPVTATITVTPSYTNAGTTCTGTPTTFTITVNPTPTVDPVVSQTACNGGPTTDINFTGSVAGTVYSWTNNTTSIGLAASGTGDILSFTATNATNAPVTATITVIPSYTNNGVTCTGSSITFTITVNPTPTINSVANQTVCNNANTAAVTFSSPTTGGTITYDWSNNTPSIGLASGGSGNIPSFVAINNGTTPVTATITVIPSYTNNGVTCTGPSISFTITVNPTPGVNPVANQAICNGSGSTPVVFSSAVPGTVFNWSNNNTAIGLGASGTGNIASFTGTNAGTTAISGTITVTPTFTNGGTTCTGTPITFTITVNPTPTVNTVANQTVCNNSSTAAVAFSGAVTGTVYNWTNNTTSIGLAASGTGNIASFTATNGTNAAVTATITVTPTYTNAGTTCSGTPKTFTITVNPTPTVNSVANKVVCNGATTSATFTGAVTGTVFNWTNNTTSIGLAASGTGNIPTFTATNTGTTPVTATITVTPSYTNGGTTCTGTSTTFTITVNPSTVIATQPANVTLCAGGNASFTVTATGVGLTYQWQVNTGSGFNNIPGSTAATLNVNSVTAAMNGYQYRVVVTGTCGAVTSTAATLTVNTAPAITTQPVNTAACIGNNATFTVVATGTALTYQWQVNTGSGYNNIPGAISASLTVNSVTAAMNGYKYRVIISGTCTPSQTSNEVTLSINQAAVITGQPASVLICFGGSASFSVTATGTGLTYQWQVNTGTGFVNIAGATSSTLIIPAPPILFSLNQYRVIVTSPCNSVTSNVATLIIFALPNISFATVPPRVCLTDTIVTLRAQPAGGTWSGRGVTGDKFSAVSAGTGVSTLTYTVINANGCISIDYFNVTVNDCKERHNTFRDAIKIYPNPSNGQFYVKFLSDIYTDVNLRLIDGSGREVKSYHFSGLTYGSLLPIDARSLGSGVYTLQAYNAADKASFRIVIAH